MSTTVLPCGPELIRQLRAQFEFLHLARRRQRITTKRKYFGNLCRLICAAPVAKLVLGQRLILHAHRRGAFLTEISIGHADDLGLADLR